MSRTTAFRATGAALVVWVGIASPAWSETRQVVLLYDERTDLPGMAVLDEAVDRTLTTASPAPIETYREAMDLSRFGSEDYRPLLRDFLRAKYAGKRIDVVIAVMGPALDFVLGHGDEVFPGAAIVFCGIDRREFGGRALPPRVTGVLLEREFAPTLEIALGLHPDTSRIVFVAGTSEFDVRLLAQAREELRAYEERFAFTYLTSLPIDELLGELSRLPPHSLVLYSTFFRDGAGEAFVTHEVVERVASAASAPVYGFVDQYLGRGIVGGHLYSLETHGEEAARLALQVLAGTEPSALAPVDRGAGMPMFDWRQLERWGVPERRLPPGAAVLFREPSVWDQYRLQVLGIAALVALQALMISGLLVQSSRRRRAELEVLRDRDELARLGRVASLGELTASVAHELNQPLGAILNNAEAAELILRGDSPDLEGVREILADIRSDDRRAADIIRRMRSLLQRHEVVRRPVRVNRMVEEILRLVRAEAVTRKVALRFVPDESEPWVAGDRVHLQQVVMNLVLNGLEAMAQIPVSERLLTVRTGSGGARAVRIAVSDSGPGLPAAALDHLFKPFYTTKESGLGMGLSITKTIVEAHEGRVWAENDAGGGATFYVDLPSLEETAA